MNIKECTTTFDVNNIWEMTLQLFIETLDKNLNEIEHPISKPRLFSFYEKFISYPIDDLKDGEDENRVDFYESISLMSWALYQEWVMKVVDENNQLDYFKGITKEDVISKFLDNLNCVEGKSLLKKILKS